MIGASPYGWRPFFHFLASFYTPVTDDRTGFILKSERHYQTIFYIVFTLMGQFCDAKVRSAHGRAEEALRQIDNRGYLLPYSTDSRNLLKVGVSFDAAERNIGVWEMVCC